MLLGGVALFPADLYKVAMYIDPELKRRSELVRDELRYVLFANKFAPTTSLFHR